MILTGHDGRLAAKRTSVTRRWRGGMRVYSVDLYFDEPKPYAEEHALLPGRRRVFHAPPQASQRSSALYAQRT
jgi:hypothetical protein